MTTEQVLTAQHLHIEALENTGASQAAETILQKLDQQLESEDPNGLLIGLSSADIMDTMHNIVAKNPALHWIISQSVGGDQFLPVIEYRTERHIMDKRVRLMVITSTPDLTNAFTLARSIYEASRRNTEIPTLVVANTETAKLLKGSLPDINFETV